MPALKSCAPQPTDVIIVGGGHNGLVAANYLAQAGLSIKLFEARGIVGGACVTEELIPGAKWSSCAFVADLIRPEVLSDLDLPSFGFRMYVPDMMGFSINDRGSHLMFHRELHETLREIERHSKRDARNFVHFGERLHRFGELMRPWLLTEPPSLAQLEHSFAQAGDADLFDEFVVRSTAELLDRYFESDHVKGFFTFFGMVSVYAGPSTPGTAYVYGHHASGEVEGEFGIWGFVEGGMGGFTQALARAAVARGVELHVSSPIDHVLIENSRATGVVTRGGDEHRAGVVISNADPKRSMLSLIGKEHLSSDLARRASEIDQRGSMARVHLLIDELPQYLGFAPGEGKHHHAHQMLGATVENFERAWTAEQAGTIPGDYALEAVIQSTTDPSLAPAGLHTLTLGVQQLPGELSGTTWDAEKDRWTDHVIDILYRYAPNLRGHILDRYTITPTDLENEWSLTGGNIFHTAMFEPHMFDQRPLPELARYRTPIEGFYLCGAGTHPGGGVMGAPGHNAAKAVLWDLGRPQPRRKVYVRRHGLVHKVMDNPVGQWLGYQVARQPALASVVQRATKTNNMEVPGL
jgi:phytoene dehydrogenase-like protein